MTGACDLSRLVNSQPPARQLVAVALVLFYSNYKSSLVNSCKTILKSITKANKTAGI
jgi:hypothetical protein